MSELPEIILRAIDGVLSEKRENMLHGAEYLLANAESPIEAAFHIALQSALSDSAYHAEIEARTQVQIGKFRVDFMLALRGQKFVVECDGHDFHERTKEQARRDRSRDRSLTSEGYVVIRFTGSEIWSDALKCAQQAVSLLEDAYYRHADAVWKAGGEA